MKYLLALLCILFVNISFAQKENKEKAPKKKYFTQKSTSSISIDGKLDDEAWSQVEWGGDYIQREPYDNQAPTQKTDFKVLYDDKFLYIAAKCYDTEPDEIVRRMSRRDGFDGDWIEFNIDSYFDKRTAFSFTITAAGVKGDEFISGDGNNWDTSWNPIWFADVNLDEEGWTAELKIPFSQLRYGNKEAQIWGLQSTRRDFRMEERSLWQHVPQNSNTWVSEFGELHGLDGIKAQKQIEIQPYVVLQADTYEPEAGNPFRDGSDFSINGGIDGKIGVTSDLILDFTVNPDFGQVEADPAALNLDGFEIFFREQRPFFVENRNLFNGQFNGGNLFYSRRIGGSPKGYPDLNENEVTRVPSNTKIWSAAKFSGKTQSGLSIGVLESITAGEKAEILDIQTGKERKETVEPLTNYFVGRLMQDLNDGNTIIGGIFTATNRNLDIDSCALGYEGLDCLRKSAYTAGLDMTHRWNDQKWFINANAVFSKVNGSQQSMINTQRSIQRLFDRVDANHLSVDSTATTLMGTGGAFELGRNAGNRKLNFQTSVSWVSPGLELNDVGFLGRADVITHNFWMYYKIGEPFSVFRNMRFNYSHNTRFDFAGVNRSIYLGANAHAGFKNFWGVGTGFNVNLNNKPAAALRGGPAMYFDPNVSHWMYVESDRRKKISLFVNVFHVYANQNISKINGYEMSINYRPSRTLELSVGPNYNRNRRSFQYVDNLALADGTRYINASIKQQTFSTSFRANYTILPNLTIQYYAEPFISKGEYFNFKKITNPLSKDATERVEVFENITHYHIEETGERYYEVDENGNGNTDFTINNPDFVFMQFRSNLVLRWEYIPGSELFLVWSQGTNSSTNNRNEELFPYLTKNLFPDERINNTFLIKATYRFLK
jgi:hypothetical protein